LRRALRLGLGAAQTLSVTQMLAQAAATYGVDPALVLAVATRESGLNPNAVSPAGAIGVMQLMPATAAALGVDPHNVAQNIDGGVRYLAQLLSNYGGDTAKATAAYNWGPGNLNKAIAANGANWLSAAPAETQNYVAALTGVVPVAPSQNVAPAPVTIDASTGQVIPDAVDVSTLPTIDSSGNITPPDALPAGMSPAMILALGLGAWALYDILRG
jgi:membrane-bound lytic murein transglycosylase B